MLTENPAHLVCIDVDAESQGSLFRHSGTTPGWISAFHLHNGGDEIPAWSLGAVSTAVFRREQQAVLSFQEGPMEIQHS